MPDKDIFDRTFAPGWTNPARKINKIGDPEIAAHATARALRKDLRALGGFPDVKKLYSLLPSCQNENSLATSEKVFKQIRDFERSSNNRDIAGFLGKAFLQTYIEITEKQRQASRNERADSTFPSQKEFIKCVCSKFIIAVFMTRLNSLSAQNKEATTGMNQILEALMITIWTSTLNSLPKL